MAKPKVIAYFLPNLPYIKRCASFEKTPVKYLKTILILLFFGSCSTNQSVVGLYGKCGKKYLGCTQIELKSDKTFEYFIYMDVGGGSLIKGTWESISNDTIVLNTYNEPRILKTSYKGKVNPDLKGKVKIRFSDKDGGLNFVNVQINDKQQGTVADENGVAEFNSKSIINIHYNFLGQEEMIEIDNPNYNEIDILIRDLDIYPIPETITDYKIVLNGKKLIMDSTYVYKKTRLKNKQWK